MKLSVGIVGLPNVGKSTLFKLLTKQDVVIANYPFATVDPNVGIVPVKDERLSKVAKLAGVDKLVPAVVEFYDIAGLVKGAHKGEGLGNQFLAKIREVSMIVHLVRVFERGDVPHITGAINPIDDIDTVHEELILKDLETVEKRIEKAERDVKTSDKHKTKEYEILQKLCDSLGKGKLASDFELGDALEDLFLLTEKPQIYVLNGAKDEISNELLQKLDGLGSEYVISDLAETDDLEELIQEVYDALGLITFFTITGGKEARAWAIKDGTSVRNAAGEVHTDFKDKFIRAEVINWGKLMEAGGWREAKSKGLIRIEGKDYTVRDGDVLIIKHS